MELELKHLAPYLPYGLNILSKRHFCKYGEQTILEVNGIAFQDTADIPYWQYEFVYDNDLKFSNINKKGFKPMLRPISDLTKEIEVNGEKFVPLVEIIKHLNFKFLRYEIKDNSLDVVFDNKPQTKERFWFSNFKGTSFYCSNMNKLMYKDIYGAMNKLFEWHFDVFGLIEKDLAIDINSLPQSSE